MRISTTISLLAFAAALAACRAESPAPAESATSTTPPAATSTTEPGAGNGPAGEVPADTREPSDGATASKPVLPDGVGEEWALYYEHGIDFVFGAEAGLAKAAETGKPMMMFYTATW